MSTPRSPPRARPSPGWAALGGHERARHLYALARHVQKHARFSPCWRAIDNGKPIRETRDIDMPLVARHFYHHAGWASADRARVPGTRRRRLRPDHPLELPAADAGLEDRAGARRGNTVVLKPAEFTPLTALLFAESARGRPAAGRRQHRHRRRRDRRGARRASRRRQDRLHRLDRSRPHHPQGDGRHRQEALARARRQVALHRVRRCRSRQRRRRRGRRHLVQPGPGLLRRLAPAVQEGIAAASSPSSRRMATLRVGDPLDKSIDIGAIVAPVQLERIAPGREGEARGRELLPARDPLPEKRLLLPADAAHRTCTRPRPWRARRSSARCWSR
jgi:aldehyde dehydrogenase (NAD+)